MRPKTSCFSHSLSHNEGVSCRSSWLLFLLVILAGCTTAPHQPPADVNLMPPPETSTPPPKPIVPVKPELAPVPAPPLTNQATNPPPHAEGWVPLDLWCQTHGYGEFRRTTTETGYNYSFVSTNAGLNGTMVVKIGSQLASWRGMEYRLAFAPQISGGHPFVHSLDIRKNFLPLLEVAAPPKNNFVIVIDPGHGGTDAGAKSVINRHTEKEYTLDCARRLQALLTTNGWTVLLTRTNDVSMSLPERVAFADQHKADFFLSLHFNSVSPDDQAAGLQTYCLTPQGMPSNETRGFKDDWSLWIPNNKFDNENIQYAARLHRAVLKVNGHLDRGVQRARFMRVVREQNCPAVLMEGGFLSNPREARHIADPAYRQKLAEALAQALLENVESPPAITNQPPVSVTAAPATNHAAVSTNAVEAPEAKKQNEREGTK